MREIKFRAWDTKDNTMWEAWNPYVSQFQAIEIADKLCAWRFIKWEEKHQYIFTQYTWLKDKNWKEIYEGDIVRILYTDWGSKSQDDTRTLEQYLIDISHKAQVVFMWDRYWLRCWEKYDSIFPWAHWFIEVIWNIYENPELIS